MSDTYYCRNLNLIIIAFFAMFKLIHNGPVVNGGELENLAKQQLNPKSLATFSHALGGYLNPCSG